MLVVHAADLHVDSALRGLAPYDGAPTERVRDATRRATKALVDACVAERAALLLLAGDVFDGQWRDFNTGLFFASELGRLREVGTRVALVRGNHDAMSQVVKNLRWSDHVRELSASAPESVLYDDLGVVVHGMSFAGRSVPDDLAARFPRAASGVVNFGLLHTSMDGRPGHDPYAPTSLGVLASKGYDYWALGHVHEREILSEAPWVVYPGNLQGRHARETGPKGATFVTVDAGRVASVEHRVLDVVRWAQIAVEASEARSVDEVLDAVSAAIEAALDAADGRLLSARLGVRAAPDLLPALFRDEARFTFEVRKAAIDRHGEDVYVERVSVAAPPGRAAGPGPLAGDATRLDAAALEGLAKELEDLRRKLPQDVVEGPERLDLSAEGLAALLPEAEALLAARLGGGDG
jgi:predicted phosphodiesterase